MTWAIRSLSSYCYTMMDMIAQGYHGEGGWLVGVLVEGPTGLGSRNISGNGGKSWMSVLHHHCDQQPYLQWDHSLVVLCYCGPDSISHWLVGGCVLGKAATLPSVSCGQCPSPAGDGGPSVGLPAVWC